MTSATTRHAASRPSDRSGFFTHHGLWAPGVRLFRQLQFKAKAAVIGAMLLVPLMLLLVTQVADSRAKLAKVANERAGAQALMAFAPLTSHLVVARNATRAVIGGFDAGPRYAQARSAADQQFLALDALLQRTQDPLKLRADFDKLRAAWNDTAKSTNGLDASGKSTVFVPVTEASVVLLQKMLDASGISQDADLNSFYLGALLAQTLPQLLEDVGQLRAWSTYVAAKGEALSGADRTQTERRYAVWDGNVRRSLQDAKLHLQRLKTAGSAAAATVDVQALDRVEAFRKAALQVVFDARPAQPGALWTQGGEAFDGLTRTLATALPVLDAMFEQRESALQRTMAIQLAVVVGGLLAALYLCAAFYKVMDGGLREVERHLKAMTQGDLTTHPSPWGKDEAARLMLTLGNMQQALREIVSNVRDSSAAITSNTDELLQASGDISTRSEQAAAALQETAASMDEIAATVRTSADNARQAATIAASNTASANTGGEVVGRVVETMHGINDASRRIGDIIGTIDSIAFQTNILALNAAVEAARAGEQGRGFAVVASEVRALAQRSSTAAREIKGLIASSLEQVERGVDVVRSAGQTMDAIVSNARQLDALIEEIARASGEQSTGVGQVGAAVQQLDGVTQQNAAVAEQSTAAAETLRQRAAALASQVDRFRLPAAC